MILVPGEPLHGAIARTVARSAIERKRLFRVLYPNRNVVTCSAILPLHLRELSESIPSGLASPEWLLENCTYFPALAPFLEDDERQDLLERMLVGRRAPNFPVCHSGGHGTTVLQSLRYCPACAIEHRHVTRVPSIYTGARWVMVHSLFGNTVCHLHGCRLLETGCTFGADGQLWHADSVIPRVMPPILAGGQREVDLARDLASLFEADCARPGRSRIAMVLRQLALEAGCRGHGGRIDPEALRFTILGRFPIEWLAVREISLEWSNTTWWIRAVGGRSATIPAIQIAILCRALGSSLRDVLRSAQEIPACRPGSTIRVVARYRETILSALRGGQRSREDPRQEYSTAMQCLRQHDAAWFDANLPAKRTTGRLGRRFDSDADEALAQAAIAKAAELRARPGRPQRITRRLLAEAMRVRHRARHMYPKLHQTIERLVDSDLAFAGRRFRWLRSELERRGSRGPSTILAFAEAARIRDLTIGSPMVLVLAKHQFGEHAKST